MVHSRHRKQVERIRRAGIDYLPQSRIRSAANPELAPNTAGMAESPSKAPPVAVAGGRGSPGDSPRSAEQLAKEEALRVLAAEIALCRRCAHLAEYRTQTVFSDGWPHSGLCLIGEAPGADEDEQGVPFVGRAGQFLRQILARYGLSSDQVYICNVLKCRPPENRNPDPTEVANCRPFLERQLDLIRPKVLVALGKYATAYLLDRRPEDTPILKMRGKFVNYRGIPVMVTLHPAYVLRNPSAERDLAQDIQAAIARLEQPSD